MQHYTVRSRYDNQLRLQDENSSPLTAILKKELVRKYGFFCLWKTPSQALSLDQIS